MSGKDEQKVIEASAAGEAAGGEALYEEAPVAASAAIAAMVETRTTELPDGTVAAAALRVNASLDRPEIVW